MADRRQVGRAVAIAIGCAAFERLGRIPTDAELHEIVDEMEKVGAPVTTDALRAAIDRALGRIKERG